MRPEPHSHPLVVWLFDQATLRFREYGPSDARGATFWDVAASIAEERAPEAVLAAILPDYRRVGP